VSGALFGSGGARDNDLDPVTPKCLVKSVFEISDPDRESRSELGSGRVNPAADGEAHDFLRGAGVYVSTKS
jgi:hypothetical protein